MTQIEKHTPGPWVCNDECLIYGQVSSDDEPEAPFVADCARECAAGQYTEQEKANTEFIVRACNSHHDLIDALESQTDAAQAVIDNWSSGNLAAAVRALDAAIAPARAVIAKAKPTA